MRDREAGRAYLRRLIWQYGGVLSYVAFDLGVRRDHVFAIVWRESLWDAVDAARAARPRVAFQKDGGADDGVQEQDDWIQRTRAALKRPVKG